MSARKFGFVLAMVASALSGCSNVPPSLDSTGECFGEDAANIVLSRNEVNIGERSFLSMTRQRRLCADGRSDSPLLCKGGKPSGPEILVFTYDTYPCDPFIRTTIAGYTGLVHSFQVGSYSDPRRFWGLDLVGTTYATSNAGITHHFHVVTDPDTMDFVEAPTEIKVDSQGGLYIGRYHEDSDVRVVAWSLVWGEGECHQCDHRYRVRMYGWDGADLRLLREFVTEQKFSAHGDDVADFLGIPREGRVEWGGPFGGYRDATLLD